MGHCCLQSWVSAEAVQPSTVLLGGWVEGDSSKATMALTFAGLILGSFSEKVLIDHLPRARRCHRCWHVTVNRGDKVPVLL